MNSSLFEPDANLQGYIDSFENFIDRKYNTIICKLYKKLTHPVRDIETSLGNLVSDAFAQTS